MDIEKRPRSMSPIRTGGVARRSRPFLALALIVFGLYTCLHLGPVSQLTTTPKFGGETTTVAKVPLEAHIMSKCPDARDCLRQLVLPAMQRVYQKVNFTLSYIGRPTDNAGPHCKHGPEECLGNIIQLCAQELYPDPKQYLGFTMCMERDFRHIPQRSLVEDCALEHALDFDKLNECATKDDGGFGIGMLRHSVKRTTEAGVTKSCTVRLDNKVYCVRDDGEWKDCPTGPGVNDLVIAIEKLYHSS